MTEPTQAYPQESGNSVAPMASATPAVSTIPITGENRQEVAAPAAVKAEDSFMPSKAPEKQAEYAGVAGAEDVAQSAEENARYASIRRRAEQEARRRTEAQMQQMQEKLVQAEGLAPTNPTGESVDKRQQERQTFQRYLTALPEIQRAREMQNSAREMQMQMQMDKEMQEISGMNPSIKSRGDLKKMPTYNEMLRLVEKGNNLVEAYKLANFETLTASAAAAKRQQLLNHLGETAHLTQTAARQGAAMEAVPADVLRQYRVFNPKATDAEIQRHYNKEIRKGS